MEILPDAPTLPVMDEIISKARARRSDVKPCAALQEELLKADASRDTALDKSAGEKTPLARDLAQDPSVQSTTSRLTSEIDPLPAKRARLTRTDAQDSRAADKKQDLGAKVPGPEQVSLLRKRHVGSDVDDTQHQLKRARLTRKNLAQFNEMDKAKKASALSEATRDSSPTTKTKTTSTTTSGFAIQAYENGILDPFTSEPPSNFDNIRKRYYQPRKTPSPTGSAYEDYVNTVGGAYNEATMVFEVGGQLLKKYDKGYKRAFNQAFTGFPKDVGFNNGLSAPQPDFVEGLRMEEYRPFPVHKHVDGAVLYKDNPRSLTLPHLAGEWKGRGKDIDEARLQSAYDGAALVYARNRALSYLGKPDPHGHAEVTTFTTDGTNLTMYAHYAAPPEDGTLEYHQYPVRSTNLVDSHPVFKDGRRGLRNEQDHAREQSHALRDQLKEHWKQRRDALQPITEGAPLPVSGTEPLVTTNAYQDKGEAGCEVVEQPYQPTPPASSRLKRQPNHGKASSSRSVSSESLSPANDHGGGGGGSSAQKRKASLSQGSSNESSRQRNKGKSH